ncbi:hypothetical protein EJ078_10845 [Mesorhizobium sp. M1A.F.Ca.IN.022.06.1.1]|uniref:hypothetical protein n=1 Tax=Mesorhizobium sp. M1A.F.Ca.IN.022.06.1.1 TaxID=2493680 RepID=UPI000F765930|nr:hypothetical protein [Mesorhizobium sp. M1A.F.Ca.IN.022.06.1.1]AZO59676.1 hypothetical protein EJ078_10845 [Mesorhizobium sp. M1A.F.Ca.IN.022.06.1.1]
MKRIAYALLAVLASSIPSTATETAKVKPSLSTISYSFDGITAKLRIELYNDKPMVPDQLGIVELACARDRNSIEVSLDTEKIPEISAGKPGWLQVADKAFPAKVIGPSTKAYPTDGILGIVKAFYDDTYKGLRFSIFEGRDAFVVDPDKTMIAKTALDALKKADGAVASTTVYVGLPFVRSPYGESTESIDDNELKRELASFHQTCSIWWR